MKWLALTLSTLPLIAVETQKVVTNYENLKQRIANYARNSDIIQFNDLREQIQMRIQMLNKFYQRNSTHQTIALFHMLKVKLQRLIFREEKIDNNTIQFSMIRSPRQHRQQEVDNFIFDQPLFKKQPKSQIAIPINKPVKNNKLKPNNHPLINQLQNNYSNKIFPKKVNSYKNKELQKNKQVKEKQKSINLITQNNQTNLIKHQQKITKIINQPSKQSSKLIIKLDQKTTQELNRSLFKQKHSNTSLTPNITKPTQNKKKKQQSKNIKIINKSNLEKSSNSYHNLQKSYQKVLNTDKKNQNLLSKIESQDLQSKQFSQALNNSEFKFTIKMTKQQYQKLLQMKKQIKLNQKKKNIILN